MSPAAARPAGANRCRLEPDDGAATSIRSGDAGAMPGVAA
jgi:hypothetical protein